MSMTNFNYGQTDSSKRSYGKTSIKDREGVDFEPQILSQRRFHTKFHTESEVSGDEKFDFRRYFPHNQIRELYVDESESKNKEFKEVEFVEDEQHGHQGGNYRGYRSRRGRGGGQRRDFEKQTFVRKNSGKEQELILENCNMANYMSLAMTRDELFQELGKVLTDVQRKTLQSRITDFYRGRINENVLFDAWTEALDKRLVFRAYPFFIATCENTETCKILDDNFYQQMLKLPKKNNALIYDFKVYREFFKGLSAEIETNIINRIKDGKIDFKNKSFVMDPPRVFQLIQIVKRLSNADMASFKFAINFGLSPKTKETINDLLLHDKGLIQQKLNTISEQEIFILLKYLQLCKHKLEKIIDNIGFSKISKNLLEEIFAMSPDIKTLFEKKLGKEEFKKLTEKEYIDLDPKPLVDNSTMPKLPTSRYEERKEESKIEAGSNFDAKNKFEFPDLKKNISGQDTLPLPPQQKKKKIGGEPGTGWEKRENPYGYGNQKRATETELKKQIEQDFPTLVSETKAGGQANYWNKLNKPVKQTTTTAAPAQAGEWDNEGEEGEALEDMVVGVVQKKGKKNKGKSTVYLTGGFK